MKKRLCGITAIPLLLLMLVTAQNAFSWSSWHNKGDYMVAPDWPQGLKELVSRDNQVGGFWMNSEYDSYQFDGDTAGMNAFLEEYGGLKDVTHKLVLHSGLPASERLTGAAGSKSRSFYEWTLNIVNNDRLRRVVDDPDMPEPAKYSVTVNLWLGGRVDLSSLKVPRHINVQSGGEIERFVSQHNAHPAQP